MTTVAEMKVKLVAAVLAQVADQDLKTEDLDLVSFKLSDAAQ